MYTKILRNRYTYTAEEARVRPRRYAPCDARSVYVLDREYMYTYNGTSLMRNADLMPTIFVGGRAEHVQCGEAGGVRFCRAESPTTGVPRS